MDAKNLRLTEEQMFECMKIVQAIKDDNPQIMWYRGDIDSLPVTVMCSIHKQTDCFDEERFAICPRLIVVDDDLARQISFDGCTEYSRLLSRVREDDHLDGAEFDGNPNFYRHLTKNENGGDPSTGFATGPDLAPDLGDIPDWE